MDDKITYMDVLQYQDLFALVPSFVLEGMARRNSNLVLKFKSSIKSRMESLSDGEKRKLGIILASDIDDLQAIMNEAYLKTNKKQFRVLANPKYGRFIEKNLHELKKMNNMEY